MITHKLTNKLVKIQQYLHKLEGKINYYKKHKLMGGDRYIEKYDGKGDITYMGKRALFADGQHAERMRIYEDLKKILEED